MLGPKKLLFHQLKMPDVIQREVEFMYAGKPALAIMKANNIPILHRLHEITFGHTA